MREIGNLPRIVALGGRAGVGKDTLAAELQRQAAYQPIAFAAPLYAILAKQCHVTKAWLHDRHVKERPSPSLGGVSPRVALQRIGDALREHEGEDVLINRLRAHTETLPTEQFVVTDLRLPREADAIREMGGAVVRVIAPGARVADYAPRGAAAGHITEMGVFRADLTLSNDGSPDEVVRSLLTSLRRFYRGERLHRGTRVLPT